MSATTDRATARSSERSEALPALTNPKRCFSFANALS